MSNLTIPFERVQAAFAASRPADHNNHFWPPVIVTRAQIDAEIKRLADLTEGRRSSLIVHPSATPGTPSLAPGIQVELNVLKPGERTAAFRHNATEVNFCLRGSGVARIGARELACEQFDVWNTPSYVRQQRWNSGNDLFVWLTYSNASLLKFMQVYVTEALDEDAEIVEPIEGDRGPAADTRRQSPYGTFVIGNDGAALMPYERLINPPAVESKALHWPWRRVEAELEKLEALGSDYIGRRLYLLYNTMTGRTNGTTPSFFATMTIRPPGIIDRPHRHVSAAINYYFRGRGRSVVAGNSYEWGAGDLMLSAPGWAVHNHASYDERVYELTIQDQPLNIVMESLLWQENLKAPPALLGAFPGFETNRIELKQRS